MKLEGLGALRLDDVVTFLTVHYAGSVTAASRKLGVTPSQVSKAVARLETFVGASLLERGPRGVSVTLAGLRAIPMLEEMARGARELRGQSSRAALTRVASPSSMVSSVAGLLARAGPRHRFQFIELDPVRTRALAYENVFDLAIVAEDKPLGQPYTHELLGEAESCLFARPSFAKKLGPMPLPSERALVGVPFVLPAVLTDTRVSPGRDACPLPVERRTPGQSATTFSVALELAVATDCVVFGPRLAARDHIARRALVEVPVRGWSVRWPVYLACHELRVQASTARVVRATMARWLTEGAE